MENETGCGPRILAVGCGDGSELVVLAAKPGARVMGCDPNAQYCKQAQEHTRALAGVRVEHATVQQVASGADEACFDEAYLLFPIPVSLAGERNEIASALGHVLVPGGELFVATEVVPILRQPSEEDSRYLCAFVNALEAQGFTVVSNDVVSFDALPAYARASTYACMFHENGARLFTVIRVRNKKGSI